MTTTKQKQANKLFAGLAKLNLGRAYVRKFALPEWWDDEIAESPSGRDELHLMLAQHLGIDPASLRSGRPQFMKRPPSKLKTSKGTTEAEVAIARQIATQVARLVALAVAAPVAIPTSAKQARDQILRTSPWVSLEALLDYCWSSGIGVVHVSHFPAGCSRMAGLVARIDGRPVIVIADRHKATGWLLFYVAHELGHVVLGHVPTDGVLVDDDMDKSSRDEEERQANAFAVELLTGEADKRVHATGRWPSAVELAAQARERAQPLGIDPAHYVLRYAETTGGKFWAVANGALAILEPGADAPAQIRQKLAANLDWSKLPRSSAEFVVRVTTAESPAT